MRILGISGSLRAGSHNSELLRLAAENLPDDVQFVVWEGLRDLPAFDEDEEDTPSLAIAGFRAAVATADAVLIATPEYNGSIPGALKNALDWASRPRRTAAFRGKPVAVIGGSPSAFGGVWAHAELRRVLGLMGARVVPVELSIGSVDDRLAEPDADLLSQLRSAADLLVAEAAFRVAAA
jgi:chromate reductase, NAD(P)H dehydrogenase (quinone)